MADKKKQKEDLTNLDPRTLRDRAMAARKELVLMRISKKSGGIKNLMAIQEQRRLIARLLTVTRQKELTGAKAT